MGTRDGRRQFGHSRDLHRHKSPATSCTPTSTPLPPNPIQSTQNGNQLTPSQSEQALALLVIPHLDLVVVTARTKDGLGRMKADASDGPVVLVVAIHERAHLVVPELDRAVVERRGEEGLFRVCDRQLYA
jgi:hypothetical protein